MNESGQQSNQVNGWQWEKVRKNLCLEVSVKFPSILNASIAILLLRLVHVFGCKQRRVHLSNSPYNPDLNPEDLVFHTIEIAIKVKRFQNVRDIKERAASQLTTIPKQDFGDDFKKKEGRSYNMSGPNWSTLNSTKSTLL